MMLLFLSLFAVQIIDFEMTPEEKKKTGVYKLNDKQKAALQSWVDNNYEKRELAANLKHPEKQPILSENLHNGTYIRLSDNSLWAIRPQDTPITQSWITAVEILVSDSGDPAYPYKLTNSLTGSSVLAKKASALPPQPKPPALPPPPAPSKK